MKKIISVCIVFSLFSLTYFQVYGDEETVTVVSHILGIHEISEIKTEMSKEKAEELTKDLKELKDAIENNDEAIALKIATKLKKYGLFHNNDLFHLIKNKSIYDAPSFLNENNATINPINLMCFVLVFGNGLFVYPLDLLAIFGIVLLFGWMPLGILLIFIYSILWLSLSHTVPLKSLLL